MIMSSNQILIISLVSLIVFLLLVFVFKPKAEVNSINFRALFIIGLFMIPLGFTMHKLAVSILGALFLIIGVAKRKKWTKQKSWDELSYLEKRTKISLLVIAFLIAVFLIMLVFI